jgi:outer membrane protein assembly factor BamE (lipoprotein component of BamABCDE complex)
MTNKRSVSHPPRHQAMALLAGLLLSVSALTVTAGTDAGISESELISLVVGKTADDVRGALGEPQQIRKGRDGVEHWFYESLVRIGKGEQRFGATEVVISSGQVNHLMNHARMPASD